MRSSPPTRRKRIHQPAKAHASNSLALALCFSLLLPAQAALATPSLEPVAAPSTSEKDNREAAYRKLLTEDAKKTAAKDRWRKRLTWVGIGGMISGLAVRTFRKQFYDHDRALEINEMMRLPTTTAVERLALENEYEGIVARGTRVNLIATGTVVASLGVLVYRYTLF